MASAETLKFDELLAPISDENPSGVALREDPAVSGLFFQVRDLANAARLAERQQHRERSAGEDAYAEASVPDWRAVHDIATEIIAKHSKDLWVCAWLTEALTRLHGFAGLRDGFRLARELSEKFWDTSAEGDGSRGIYPRPDDDGYATTVAQFTGLNGDDSEGALIRPIDQVPITANPPLSSIDYKDALQLEKTSDLKQREQRIDEGARTLSEFESAVHATSREFFETLLEDLASANEEFRRLSEVFDAQCGTIDGYPASPPTSNIKNALSEAESRVRSLTKHLFGATEDEGTTPAEAAAGGGGAPAGGAPVAAGSIRSREDAFRSLLKVADFFRNTEPHSPVSYALEQAVRWGRMSLPDLMKDLIADDGVRSELFRRAGITEPEAAEEN
jgi:type VI secretion system protein ImpA